MKGARGITLLSLIVVCIASDRLAAEPEIQILPADTVVLGEPVAVRVTGLPPKAQVRITAESGNPGNNEVWRSSATFSASEKGEVDVSAQAPVSGDYTGVDPAGLFWSMKPSDTGPSVPTETGVDLIHFSAIVDGKTVATKTHKRLYMASNVTTSPVMQGGILGRFFKPEGVGPYPGIILLGGTSGGMGWQQSRAQLLSSLGYATLALPYFGLAGLPEYLQEVPLEYFGAAIEWMKSEPSVDGARLGVVGVSKGGELALLLGATYPDIKAVVAFSPSSVVFQSVAPDWPRASSWTKDGEPMPFVPYDISDSNSPSAVMLTMHERSLKDEEAVNKARIPVERTQGAILLISGEADIKWPSTAMCRQIVERLKASDFPHPYEHLSFPNAGHSIAEPGYSRMREGIHDGGTLEGNARAMARGWSRMLQFFDENLKKKSSGG